MLRGSTVAIKKMKRSDEDAEFRHEVDMLASIRHPNVVLFLGVSYQDNFKFIIFEYMSGGSLEQLLYKKKKRTEPITFAKKIAILSDVARVCRFMF
jgi:serine/threonine protein kinase